MAGRTQIMTRLGPIATGLRPRPTPVSLAAWTRPYSVTTPSRAPAASPVEVPSHPATSPPPSGGSGRQPPKPRSATSEFYRALVPSMLHCLALGSIVYYALELGYVWLAREKEGEELRLRVAQLESELAVARTSPLGDAGTAGGGALAGSGEKRSWWKLW
ncbi:hypothetical protein BMF94_4640 [Rhodotorula taiwanensis]|uniref:Uncharacterized protein n=1 Tax=Rhodotorula taiwanensis TaxID=741276 RepID=A0A2S5B6C7_9BASI|nr:hypothetical protein BMF94_4640 [Rhodotorula taiwanensis]